MIKKNNSIIYSLIFYFIIRELYFEIFVCEIDSFWLYLIIYFQNNITIFNFMYIKIIFYEWTNSAAMLYKKHNKNKYGIFIKTAPLIYSLTELLSLTKTILL